MKSFLLFIVSLVISCAKISAQDSSLIKMLDDSMSVQPAKEFVKATYKGTTLVNLQTVEQPAKNVLQLMIMHRFGKLNDGGYNFFGLDNATLRLGLDYGLTNRLAIGVGRSSLDKTFDGSVKYKLLQQRSNVMPVSLNIYASLAYPTLKYTDKPYLKNHYRKIYTTQIIAARKISSKFSLEVSPTWLHFNLVPTTKDKNDVFAIGSGGRMKITKRTCIIAEYNFVPKGQLVSTGIHNSFSGGIEMETGGHVFQLIFTNSQGMADPYYLAKTTGQWHKGDVYFGFNISRVFNLKK